MTTSKSKLKVWEVPFSTTISGIILVLAESPEKASKFLNQKFEDGSLGVDLDNITEEGILHDGSIHFKEINATEIGMPKDSEIKESDVKPQDHGDWDAFDEETSETESNQDGKA